MEKVSEYLDHTHKPIMHDSWSYVKDSGDFLKKLKILEKFHKEPSSSQQMLLDYPNIFPGEGLETLRKRLNERETPRVPTEELMKIADFVLKNNFFEFNGGVKRQKLETAIGTKFAPLYACILYKCCSNIILYKSVFTIFFMAVVLTTYFLYELMEKKNTFSFLMNLITSTLILSFTYGFRI